MGHNFGFIKIFAVELGDDFPSEVIGFWTLQENISVSSINLQFLHGGLSDILNQCICDSILLILALAAEI
jgi:hypothetical protein